MPKEENTDAKQPEPQTTEGQNAAEAPAPEPQDGGKPGLSRRDALQMAMERLREDNGDAAPAGDNEKVAAPTQPAPDKQSGGIEAPSEFTAEEKADFYALSPKQQEAQLRLLNSRKKFWEEGRQAREAAKAEREALQREKKEVEYAQRLAKNMEAYLKSRGAKGAPEEELLKAFEAIQELNTGDPRIAAAKFLEAKGVELSEEARAALLNGAEHAAVSDAQISPLRKELDEVKQELANQRHATASAVLSKMWEAFRGEKNAAGGPKFPDISDDGPGLKLAASMGSLVRGDSELSKQFVASAQDRIPGLTSMRLLEEAYRFCGGRVDETSTAKSKDAKSHVNKANRAAASISGSSALAGRTGQIKKFSNRRDALAAALAALREREG